MIKKTATKLSTHSEIFRYFVMASLVVAVEVGSFWLMNSKTSLNYLLATVISMGIGIILNWLGSKYFVFKKSRFHPVNEFILVAIVSLVGVGLQLITIFVVVQNLHTLPVIGKFIAICITFIWNFLIRKLYIFKNEKDKIDNDPYFV